MLLFGGPRSLLILLLGGPHTQIPDDTSYYPQQQFSTFLVTFDVFWQVRTRARSQPNETDTAERKAHPPRFLLTFAVLPPSQIVTADDWEFLMFDTMQAQWSNPTGYPVYNVFAVAIAGLYIFVLHLIACCTYARTLCLPTSAS